ncbi:conserved hypothetical protein [Bathymodiolus platifrons methanotrophic gill symbiont]|uniref:helix-turn-helix domain-containing protein n=1 Tax=Bathymodiolus platifrons methanotrophic gill symbiont TaxID=113268 RepID=UPI000B40FD64|nr:helix-turn-helix transcriptional regulator [Bathymodiolus platifrons methanotrophic gill symbiont]GAW87743.1 conserved hypothetical protein [Bathymodiolus platifrons methanotrophic gill symbiont]GFO76162.1 hypothetical protein BPLS_P3791 [Bathymodiolus platifrons methanotrophic gill symbiont]
MGSNVWNGDNKIIQTLLRDLRKESGLTQLQLANLLDHPQSYVSKYEMGERKLDLPEIRRISICCGSNLHKFVAEFEKRLSKKA